MKRKVIIKKAIAVAVTMSLMTCLVPNGSITVDAASKKSMLSKTKISVNVGKKKTVKLKKAKYKVVWKIISGKKQKWPNTIKNYLAEPPVSCYNIPIDAVSRAGPLLAAYHVRRIF